jgi:hypothetical protein
VEFLQSTLEEIIESERLMLLTAEDRYGKYYMNARACSIFLSRCVTEVDRDRMMFARFFALMKKHHMLALLSVLRLHKVHHFMNLLNRAVYGAAFRRYGKRLRVLPVLEKGEVRARALRPWERGTSGRWHIHCAIELPSHVDAVALENLICDCWAKVEWGHGRIRVRDGANAGWIQLHVERPPEVRVRRFS